VKIFSSNEENPGLVICGRTDAGVHAYANVAHVDITRKHKRDPTKIVFLH
jgi:tRNA pseudouridine(38-40) synthase